jgi:hypothetical protein|tara:strand:+ start:2293 stop:2511 length:219 start_codon:yes stop_codon:yes gene_type:complete
MEATYRWAEALFSENPVHKVRSMTINELRQHIRCPESRKACKNVYNKRYTEQDRLIASSVLYARNLLKHRGC